MKALAQVVDDDGTDLRVALRILRGAVAAGASDIHLKVGVAPRVRIEGEFCVLDHPPTCTDVVQGAIDALVAWAGIDPAALRRPQVDFSCEVPQVGRFRAHVYRQGGSPAAALRIIPTPIPDLSALRLPPVIKRIALSQRGLVAVTGATGNGKSTSIASMLDFLNKNASRHVVTIEHPIEYVFQEERCSFAQREVGRDVDSIQGGLEASLRQDPDVVFVGETRTLEELDVVLNAAESGRLIFTTFHSADVARAITRMINLYPPDYRDSARNRLADVLTAIVSQRLVARRGARERILITEVLTRAPTVIECIRDPKRFRGLTAALAANTHEHGTHSFDQVLHAMVRDALVTVDTAKASAHSAADFVRNLKLSR